MSATGIASYVGTTKDPKKRSSNHKSNGYSSDRYITVVAKTKNMKSAEDKMLQFKQGNPKLLKGNTQKKSNQKAAPWLYICPHSRDYQKKNYN